jgi:hypothetical protein
VLLIALTTAVGDAPWQANAGQGIENLRPDSAATSETAQQGAVPTVENRPGADSAAAPTDESTRAGEDPPPPASASPAVANPGAPPLTLRQSGPFLLKRAKEVASTDVPVKVGDGVTDADELRFVVTDASYDNVIDPVLTQSFSVSWREAAVEDSAPFPRRLQVRLQLEHLQRQRLHGAYVLNAAVLRGDQEVGTLEIKVNFPKSVLAAPAPIYAERFNFLWLCCCETASPLVLRVLQGPMPADVVVVQADNARINQKTVTGRISLATPVDLNLNQPTSHTVSIDTPFPLGDATGNLLVASPDIDPLSVEFTVRSRQHWTVIVLLTVIGLVMGFATRVGLTGYIESRQLKLRIKGVSDRLKGYAGRKHGPFESALKDLQARAAEVLKHVHVLPDQTQLEDLTSKINKLQEDLEAALTEFERERASLDSTLQLLANVLDANWTLPRRMEEERQSRLSALASARLKLNEGDLTAASAALRSVSVELPKQLEVTYRDWRRAALREVRKIRELEKLPAPLGNALPAQWQKVGDSLPEDITVDPDTPASRSEAICRTASRGRQMVIDFTDNVVSHVADTMAMVEQMLEDRRTVLPKPAAIANLQKARKELSALKLADAIDQLPPAEGINPPTDAIRERLRTSLAALRTAILDQTTTTNVQPVTSELDAAQYVAACSLLPLPTAGPVVTRQAIQGTVVTVRNLAEAMLPSVRGPIPVQRMVSLPPRVTVDVPQAMWEIFLARLLQFGLLAIVIACIAVITYVDTFVGTVKECATIGMWAFGLDWGLNTVVDRARGVTGG